MTSRHEDSPAVIETRLVHDAQRRATSVLADALDARSIHRVAVAEVRDFVVATLDHHHRSEDSDLWPMLSRVNRREDRSA